MTVNQSFVALGDGSASQFGQINGDRVGQMNDKICTNLQAMYYENSYRKHSFWAANQAAQAVSVALATTYTGICLSNPAGSGFNLVPKKVSCNLAAAPAAIAPIGIITGYLSTGVTAHTTPLTVNSTIIGTGPKGVGLVDAACTLVGTPAWAQGLMGGFTAAALPSPPVTAVDLDGLFIIPPGGYIAIGALTAISMLGFISWDEVPV